MGLSTDLNIFQKQYKNKIQTELFQSYDVFFLFCFQRIKAWIMPAVLNWNKILVAILRESEAKLEMKNFKPPSIFVWK